MYLVVVLLSQVLTRSLVALDQAPTTEQFDNKIVLIQPDLYVLHWSYNQSDIVFELHVTNTPGWIMFGLSADGSTAHSDVIFAWTDFVGYGRFYEKSSQHVWTPLVAKKLPLENQSTVDILKFSRKLITCHSNSLSVAFSNYLIFSTGRLDSLNQVDLSTEQHRGSKLVRLIRDDDFKFLACDKRQFELNEVKPTTSFANKNELLPHEYLIYWNVTGSKFIGELHVRTNGWILFGFSLSAHLADSDILVTGVDKGVGYIRDCFIHGNKLMEDHENNLELVYSREMRDYTVIRFERELKSCDRNDKPIQGDTPYIVFGYGSDDPSNLNQINLSSLSLSQLNLASRQTESKFTDMLELDLEGYILPENDQIGDFYYFCKSFRMDMSRRKQIIGWEVTSNTENVERVTLYECSGSEQVKRNLFEHEYLGECLSNHHIQSHCNSPLIYWKRGAEQLTQFPDDTGYPIGKDSGYSFVILEVLYQNKETDSISYISSVKLKLHLTDKLRPHELGVLVLGVDPDPTSILIPPNLEHYSVSSYCFNDCVKSKLENVSSITMVMAYPHTVSAGRHVSTQIVRNDRDAGYLHHNKFYDPRFESYLLLQPRIQLDRFDSLITRCVFSTRDRNELTFGGWQKRDEVCSHQFFYYPRISNFRKCGSLPTFDDQLNALSELKKKKIINFKLSAIDKISINSKLSALYDAYHSLKRVGNLSIQSVRALFADTENKHFYSTCQRTSLNKMYRPINASLPKEKPIMDLCKEKSETKNLKIPLRNSDPIAYSKNSALKCSHAKSIIVLFTIVLASKSLV